jgi:hypothetical protein
VEQEFADPKIGSKSVNVSAYGIEETGRFVAEKREFNRFKVEDVPSVARHRDVKTSMGRPVEHEENGMCWPEQEFEVDRRRAIQPDRRRLLPSGHCEQHL